MLTVYEQRKDADGFLYIVYTEESTLGGDYAELEGEKEEEIWERNWDQKL